MGTSSSNLDLTASSVKSTASIWLVLASTSKPSLRGKEAKVKEEVVLILLEMTQALAAKTFRKRSIYARAMIYNHNFKYFGVVGVRGPLIDGSPRL